MRGKDEATRTRRANSAKVALNAYVENENDDEECKVDDNYCYCDLQSGVEGDAGINGVHLLI